MATKDWPGGVISKTPVVPAGSYAGSAASGVWTLDQVAYWNKQGTWPGLIPGDPYFYDVSLLLTGDGTNGAQNNTFLDSSTNNFTITRNGNPTQGTFSSYGNLWSNYFDGSGDYLSTPYNAALDLNSGDWTFEAWVYPGAPTGNYKTLWSFGPNSSNFCTFLLFDNGTNYSVQAYYIQNATNTAFSIYPSTYNIAPNTWTHIALQRSGTALYVYVNGVLRAYANTATNVTAIGSGTNYIGARWDTGLQYAGYISNMRVVKGSAVYQTAGTSIGTTYFSPSSAPLTAVTNTSLLTCQSNRFKDNSSNNFTLTANGDTKVQRFSPFNPAAPYSASTIGGSGYFDGDGDYLTTAASAAFVLTGGAFTVEAWIFPSLVSAYTTIIDGGMGSGFGFSYASDGAFVWQASGAQVNAGTAIKKNQWNHLVANYSGSGSVNLYVNGISVSSSGAVPTNTGTKSLYIGKYSAGQIYTGLISGLRIVKGSAVYTNGSTITVPTAPPTAVTNTSLLLNFTNAGIPDAAMMNDLETVGNAQVSTSVVKYGTGSLYFDGTEDCLTTRNSTDLFDITKCDFTWEAWIYRTVQNVDQEVSNYRSGDGWFVRLTSANKVKFSYVGGSELTSTGSISLNTWTHLAITRSGSTVRIFFNGVQDSSATFANGSAANTALIIGKDEGSTGYYTGYIDDLRITKGYARYTANFTPPTAAFPTY